MNPKIIIDLKKFTDNLDYIGKKMKAKGLTFTHITKGYAADPKIVKAADENKYVDYLGDARIENIKNYPEVKKSKILIRIPMHSEIEDVIRYADISFNSEISTVRSLNNEAKRQKKTHKIVLMVDLGDLREGYFDAQELHKAVNEIRVMTNIRLFGLAVNLTCFGGVIPEKGILQKLVDYKNSIESSYGLSLSMISGGNSSSLYLLDKNGIPDGINNLRLGEAIIIGRETAFGRLYDRMHHDVFTLSAELVEIKEKPSVPIGNIGMDAFGQKPVFEDKGQMLRGIVAIGRQDIDYLGLVPIDKRIVIIGASSDHLILDLTKCKKDYKVGDSVQFYMNYSAVLSAFTSKYVKREYIPQQYNTRNFFYKKSAERPLSDVQTGAPRNEIKETRRGTSRC